MAVFKGTDVGVLIHGYNPGTHTTELDMELSASALDATKFQDSAERIIPGVRKDKVHFAGWWDDNAQGLDAGISNILGTGGRIVTVLIGTGTGSRSYVGTGLEISQKQSGRIGELVRIEAFIEIETTLERGVNLAPGGIVSTTGNQSSTSVDTGAGNTTTAGARAYVQIIKLTQTGTLAAAVAVDHSTDGTTWAEKGSATFTTIGATLLSFSGTINRYLRQASGTHSGLDYQVTTVRL